MCDKSKHRRYFIVRFCDKAKHRLDLSLVLGGMHAEPGQYLHSDDGHRHVSKSCQNIHLKFYFLLVYKPISRTFPNTESEWRESHPWLLVIREICLGIKLPRVGEGVGVIQSDAEGVDDLRALSDDIAPDLCVSLRLAPGVNILPEIRKKISFDQLFSAFLDPEDL